jgi:hypothetical protein
MGEVVDFIDRHGEVFVFLYVLADQLGVPCPPSRSWRWARSRPSGSSASRSRSC